MKKMIDKNTKTAKETLLENGYTCVLYSYGAEYHSFLRGVKPLIEFLESGENFKGFCAADKTVGLGAAHLYILLGVKSVWANIISQEAKELLERNNIGVYCENTVPFIINRKGDGPCPIESAVKGIASSLEAFEVIKETLDSLNKVG